MKPAEARTRFFAAVFIVSLPGLAAAHTGLLDGYGCHRGRDKSSYHCHEGPYAGRTFKTKEEFLRQLRSGKAEQLAPKNSPPGREKKAKD